MSPFRIVFVLLALSVLGGSFYSGWQGIGAATIASAAAGAPSLRSGSPRGPGYVGRIK